MALKRKRAFGISAGTTSFGATVAGVAMLAFLVAATCSLAETGQNALAAQGKTGTDIALYG